MGEDEATLSLEGSLADGGALGLVVRTRWKSRMHDPYLLVDHCSWV